ncbi:MAG: N-acetyltransferase [Pseudomonadota bacterium]
MKLSLFGEAKSEQVIDLFRSVFTASEGEAEGQVIADFVSNLITTTESQDLIGCVAEANEVVGSIFFSRLIVSDRQSAFILSPVAISTAVQGRGFGQELINFGLDHLRSINTALVFTYGDPSFYSKVGFEHISEAVVKAPYPLSQPEGWLVQSLDGNKIVAIQGHTQCVAALQDPSLW